MFAARYFETGSSRRNVSWVPWLAAGLLWFLLLKELAVDWNIDPQYSYGWGVPPLLLYLFWKRWLDRPAPATPPIHALFWLVGGCLALTVMPLRLVQEANPDWRLLSWWMAGTVVALSLGGAYYCGGRPWSQHFGPVILFVFLSVPWPGAIEHNVSQALMRGVAVVTAEAMNWLGKGAAAQGNIIMLTTGGVGVTEACSGIRSFQTSCMLALFFGELYRRSAVRRVLILVLGLAAAVLVNALRAFVLTWLCAQEGPEFESAWHDRIGLGALILTVLVVWLIARVTGQSSARLATGEHRAVGLVRSSRGIPLQIATLLCAWFVLVEGTVQGWYRWHEMGMPTRAAWSVSWPATSSGFQEKALPEETRKLLRCDESQSGRWLRADGADWTLFFLRWQPGRMAAQLAKGHTPDVCLPANGFRQVANLGRKTLLAHGISIPFNTYVFSANGQLYHVFFCQVDDRPGREEHEPGSEASTYLAGLEPMERLRAVRQGRRHAGHQVLEIAMTGYATQEEALQALQSELPSLVAPLP